MSLLVLKALTPKLEYKSGKRAKRLSSVQRSRERFSEALRIHLVDRC